MVEAGAVNNGSAVRLRPVTAEDEAFLMRVYASTRAQELALVPWDEAQRAAFLTSQFKAQWHHYQSNFPEARYDIIEHSGQAVGRLYVLRTAEFIRILDLTVLPEFSNAGLGTQLITELFDEAAAAEKPLRIYVESFNPSLRLFERLGFRKVDEQGIHFLMEKNWRG